MKKSTLYANAVLWAAIALACIAFLAWYHLGCPAEAQRAVADSAPGRIGLTLAAPALLYAIGALGGLVLAVWKRVVLGRAAKTGCRVAAVLTLALFAAAAIPAAATGLNGNLALPTVVVVYAAMAAPLLVVALGFCWGISCAPEDRGGTRP